MGIVDGDTTLGEAILAFLGVLILGGIISLWSSSVNKKWVCDHCRCEMIRNSAGDFSFLEDL